MESESDTEKVRSVTDIEDDDEDESNNDEENHHHSSRRSPRLTRRTTMQSRPVKGRRKLPSPRKAITAKAEPKPEITIANGKSKSSGGGGSRRRGRRRRSSSSSSSSSSKNNSSKETKQDENVPPSSTENSKSFFVLAADGDGKTPPTSLKTSSVVRTIQLSSLKDYLHCYKCFSTFYKINELINHAESCSSQNNRDGKISLKEFQNPQKQFKDASTSTVIIDLEAHTYKTLAPSTNYRLYNSKSARTNKLPEKETSSLPSTHNNNDRKIQPNKSQPQLKPKHKSHISPSKSKANDSDSDCYSVSPRSNHSSNFEGLTRISSENSNRLSKKEDRMDKEKVKEKEPKNKVVSKEKQVDSAETKKKNRNYLPEKFRFKCAHCPRKYGTERELNQHGNAHKGLGQFQCPQEGCGKSFCWKKSLNRHMAQGSCKEGNNNGKIRRKRAAPKVKKSPAMKKKRTSSSDSEEEEDSDDDENEVCVVYDDEDSNVSNRNNDSAEKELDVAEEVEIE